MAGLTVESLAATKRLPVAWLREAGVGLYDADDAPAGVRIPYFDAAGSEVVGLRYRTAPAARDGSSWRKGDRATPYGRWRAGEGQRAGYTHLVEGESNCWACWHAGIPALGLPGAGTFGALEAEDVVGLQDVYLARDPDPGGETFVKGVLDRLAALDYRGRAWDLRTSRHGFKDLADLYKADPQGFVARVADLQRAAGELEVPLTLNLGERRRLLRTLQSDSRFADALRSFLVVSVPRRWGAV